MTKNQFFKDFETVKASFDKKGRQLCDGCFFDETPFGQYAVEGADVCTSKVCKASRGLIFKKKSPEVRQREMTLTELSERYYKRKAPLNKKGLTDCCDTTGLICCAFYRAGYKTYTVEGIDICVSMYCNALRPKHIFIKRVI